MKRRSGMVASLLLLVELLLTPGALAAGPTDDEIQSAIAERLVLGLPADPLVVRNLLTNEPNEARTSWGMPLTDAELLEIDPAGRMEFAQAVSAELVPYARAQPNFGGAYVDQARGGRLVLQFSALSERLRAEINARIPQPSLGVDVVQVSHRFEDLSDALNNAYAAWRNAAPKRPEALVGVAADSEHNRLELSVIGGGTDGERLAMERSLGVTVHIQPGAVATPDVCSSRDNCTGPTRTGVRIFRGLSGETYCTMGFHIVRSSDEQFLTSGHCGFTGSNNWYHSGYGYLGFELQTAYYAEGVDLMRVGMPDAQASDLIYGEGTRQVIGSRAPIQGEQVCASLGFSGLDCGYVAEDFFSYRDSYGYVTFGADHNSISTQGGDSGSPIYVRTTGGAIAVGSHSASGGQFARIHDLAINWSFSMVT